MHFSIHAVFGVFLFFIAFPCVSQNLADNMMYYKMWGSYDGRHEYQVKVFKLAMELTASEYPPYVLTQYNQSMGSLRGRREVAKADRVNFYVAPPRSPGDELYEEVVAIPIPIMKGMLGYRKFIIDKENLSRFSGIRSESDLKKLKAGQARGWPDVDVYKTNGYPIEDSGLFPDLFAMLDHGRFDYLPMGIMEADNVLASWGKGNENLITIDSIYIYYPLPAVFQISAKEKKLIERLSLGLQRASNNGSMDELFYSYFEKYLLVLANEDYQLVVLSNPRLESTLGLAEPLLSKNFLELQLKEETLPEVQ